MRTRFWAILIVLVLLVAAGGLARPRSAQAQYSGNTYMSNGIVWIQGPGAIIGESWDLTIYLPVGYYQSMILTLDGAGYAYTPGIPTSGFSISAGGTDSSAVGSITLNYPGYTLHTTGWVQSAVISIQFTNYSNSYAQGQISYFWQQNFSGSGGSYGQYNSTHWCGYYWGTCDVNQAVYFYGSCGMYYGYCDYYAPYYFAWDYTNYCYCIYAGYASQYGQYMSTPDDADLTYDAAPGPDTPTPYRPNAPKFKPPKGHEDTPPPITKEQFFAKLGKYSKINKFDMAVGVMAPPQHFDAPQATSPKQQ